MQPMIDIMSSTWQVELNLIAQQKELEMINASPEMKLKKAAEVFWWDWAYVWSEVIWLSNTVDFWTLLTKAWESIRANKLSEQKSMLQAQTDMQKQLMSYQDTINDWND